MPEVHFEVRWPDGRSVVYYSPSTSVHAYMIPGESYSVADFVARSRSAMHTASERVRAKYGYTCSSAMDTLSQIEAAAISFGDDPAARVQVLTLHPARDG